MDSCVARDAVSSEARDEGGAVRRVAGWVLHHELLRQFCAVVLQPPWGELRARICDTRCILPRILICPRVVAYSGLNFFSVRPAETVETERHQRYHQ